MTIPALGSVGEGVLANERDNLAVAKACGMKRAYDYRNHMLDGVSQLEFAAAAHLSIPPAESGHGHLLRPNDRVASADRCNTFDGVKANEIT
jgi:hypothetical protein